jgi:hypothetical protein
MSSESREKHVQSAPFPQPLERWLAERAEEAGVDRDELLVGLVSAYRAAMEAEVDEERSVGERGEERVEAVIDERIERADTALDDRIEELRRRVVTVEREADAGADTERVDRLERRLDALRDDVGGLEDRVAGIGESVEAVETTLGEVEDGPNEEGDVRPKLEEVDGKLDRLARVVVGLREDLGPRPGQRPGTLRGLKREAAREGMEGADCTECDATVDLALLAEPACPHCGASFGGLAVDGPSDATLVGSGDGSVATAPSGRDGGDQR